MEELTIDDLPKSVFPKEPDKDNLCLTCRKSRRERFSWFCCKECELSFIKKHEVEVVE